MKISKVIKINLTLFLIILAVSMIKPISAGTPGKLQKVQDEGVRRIHYNFADYYDDFTEALIYQVSVEEQFYFLHGWYYDVMTHHNEIDPYFGEKYPNYGWFMGFPLTVDIYLDGERLATKRYSSGSIHFEWFDPDLPEAGVQERTQHFWNTYYIFDLGELAVGDHPFTIVYSATDFYYDAETGNYYKLAEPFVWDVSASWEVPLVIRVTS